MKQKITTFLILFFLVGSQYAFSQTANGTTTTFTTLTAANGFSLAAGHTYTITVEAWGGGGGTSNGNTVRKAGGGGGGYYSVTYNNVPGKATPYTITVGAGGVDANDGGNSRTEFGDDVAGGGSLGAGAGAAGGTATGTGTGTFVAGGAGGERSNSATATGGGGGGSGSGSAISKKGVDGNSGGTGGTGGGGNGGVGVNPGTNGSVPGGGAGGKGTGGVGGANGGDGQVIVTVVSSALPVELVRFNANAKDNRILLEWQTASELNNKGFLIEKGYKTSSELEWSQLDFIDGNGTTLTPKIYSFIDQDPKEGANYYRLKQIDYDGNYEYSSIIQIEYSGNDKSKSVSIFPNPVRNQLMLSNGKGKVTIYNALGQPVKHLTIEPNQESIQLTDLSSGQYYLQLIQEDGTVIMKQFSKL